jgi:lipopolysaccharide exporter
MIGRPTVASAPVEELAAPPMVELTPGLTATTVQGLTWTYGCIGLTVCLQLAYTAVMSRLLLPADFGLVALATLPLQLSSHIANLGIESAVVQKSTLDNRDVRVAFTGAVALGLLSATVLAVVAPLAGWAVGSTAVVPILRALGLTYAIAGFGTVAMAMLRRHMTFRRIALIEVGSYTLSFPGVGIACALAGLGVWSLVAAALAQALLVSGIGLLVVRHDLHPLVDRRRARRLYGFGTLVSLNGILEFFGGTADTFAVGRFLGTDLLGQYSRASLVIGLPMSHLSTGATKVLMPGFSQLKGDLIRSRGAYLRALALLTGLIFPFGAVAAALAVPLVSVLLGDQWGATEQVLPVVGLAVAFGFVQHLSAVVCEARGRLSRKLTIQVAYLAVVVAAVVVVVVTGPSLLRLAAVFTLGQILQHLLYLAQLRSDLAIATWTLARIHAEAVALAAVAAGAAVLGSSLAVAPPLRLLGGVMAATIVWGLAVVLVRPLRIRVALADLVLHLPERLSGRFAGRRGAPR